MSQNLHKTLFVDVDGVLNTVHTTEEVCGWCFVEDRKLDLLREIVDATGAELVLSSDWRFLRDIPHQNIGTEEAHIIWERFNAKLAEHGMKLAGVTGEYSWSRGAEICAYVNAHPEIDRWAALDDIPRLDAAEPCHIWTSGTEGLTSIEVHQCIQLLNDDEVWTDAYGMLGY